ncbi:MAG: Gfo/Idh/MocA family oxidoreductase, partial [SAR324 cluster bacterium]|nr:Gfo/Idh/MocA family oxidoreductase [SAR324 cluster bacterium]
MRILIIGAGSVTRSMIKSALKFSWFRELSIVEPNSKSIEHLRAHFPNLTFPEFTSIDEALSSSSYDSVWINTPSHLHYEHIFHSLSTTSQIL